LLFAVFHLAFGFWLWFWLHFGPWLLALASRGFTWLWFLAVHFTWILAFVGF
jgi:hypothetical protein